MKYTNDIVKVQRPLIHGKNNNLVLVYNQDRSAYYQGEVGADVIKAMRGSVEKKHITLITIDL